MYVYFVICVYIFLLFAKELVKFGSLFPPIKVVLFYVICEICHTTMPVLYLFIATSPYKVMIRIEGLYSSGKIQMTDLFLWTLLWCGRFHRSEYM